MNRKKDGKKSFYELSELAQFHLAPKLFGENAEYPFYEDSHEIRLDIGESALRALENNYNLSSIEGNHFVNLIKDVLSIKLMDEAQNDPVEKKKLQACREKIRDYVVNVLNSIKDYIGAILALEEASKGRNKTEIENADKKRSLTHDRLIGDINILNRSLVWWFGKFDPANLSEKQLEMYEKQEERYISDKIERINISQNGICPPEINVKNRKEITSWAKAIYKDIITIKSLSSVINPSSD